MGWLFYLSAIAWAAAASESQDYTTAAVFFVGGAIIFAIEDRTPASQETDHAE